MKAIVLIILLIVTAFIVFYGINSSIKIKNNYVATTGIVGKCTVLTKGAGQTLIDYTFKVNGKIQRNSSSYNDISIKVCNDVIVNKSFPVLYEKSNSSNSIILITPRDFNYFGILFPDSIKWVKSYLN